MNLKINDILDLMTHLSSFSQRVSFKSKFCWSASFKNIRFSLKISFYETKFLFCNVNSYSLMYLVYEVKILLLYFLAQSTLRLRTPFSCHFHSFFFLYGQKTLVSLRY